MRERGCFSTTTLAQPRRPCRPRHPCAVPRTLFQCVCTRRRNCIGQLSPFLPRELGAVSLSAPIRVPALFPDARRTALDSERPSLCNAVGKLGRTPVRHVLRTCERVRLGVGRWALAPPCGGSS